MCLFVYLHICVCVRERGRDDGVCPGLQPFAGAIALSDHWAARRAWVALLGPATWLMWIYVFFCAELCEGGELGLPESLLRALCEAYLHRECIMVFPYELGCGFTPAFRPHKLQGTP